MATEIERLVLNLDANITGMRKQLDKAAQATNQSAKKIEKRFDKMNDTVSRSGLKMARQLQSGIAAIGLSLAVRQVAEYADAWRTASNRLAAAGVPLEDLADTQNRLVELSIETRTSLTATTELYSRLTRATDSLGVSQEEVYRATQIANQAFKAGGAAASEQRSAVLQLGQSLGSGILAGDELRAIRENAPLLAQAIAEEFDTTVAGLKELGAQGELTSDRVFAGILRGGAAIQSQFSVTEATIEDSLTNIGTAFTRLIGTLDNAVGGTEAFGDFARGLQVIALAMERAFPEDALAGLDRRIQSEITKSVATVGTFQGALEDATGAQEGLTAAQIEALRASQATGEYQKQQQLDRLNALRDELALVIELEQADVDRLRALNLNPNSSRGKLLGVAEANLSNQLQADEVLGAQIARIVETPAAAFADAADDLSEGAGKVAESFKDSNFSKYETDLEKLNETIRQVSGAYGELTTELERAKAAQGRVVDDGSDDALRKLRATAKAVAEVESKMAAFGGSRALVQAILDYGRATDDLVGSVAQLERLRGLISPGDIGLAMDELRTISEDLSQNVLVGEDKIEGDFQRRLSDLQAARAAAAAVGIANLTAYDRALDEAYSERAQALADLARELNPTLKDLFGADATAQGDLTDVTGFDEYDDAANEFRDAMRESVKDAMREGIQTNDWQEAFRGILADAVTAGFEDALNSLGDFLADVFFGTNGNSGFFGNFAASLAGGYSSGGGRAIGGPVNPNTAYKVNEGGRGEFLYMGAKGGEVFNMDQMQKLTGSMAAPVINIDGRVIIQGDMQDSTLAKMREEQSRRDMALMQNLPKIIESNVNSAKVHRRLR